MKDGFSLFRALKNSMQRNFRRKTRIVHLPDFESKSPYELSCLLHKNLRAHFWIFSIFRKELADEKYHTKGQ